MYTIKGISLSHLPILGLTGIPTCFRDASVLLSADCVAGVGLAGTSSPERGICVGPGRAWNEKLSLGHFIWLRAKGS